MLQRNPSMELRCKDSALRCQITAECGRKIKILYFQFPLSVPYIFLRI